MATKAVETETVETVAPEAVVAEVTQATPTPAADATAIQRAVTRPFQTSATPAEQSNEELNHRFSHVAPEGLDIKPKFTVQ